MATTTSSTTTYAGESAGQYISAALLIGSTLEAGGVTIKPNVKFKEGDKGNNVVTGQKIDLNTNRISEATIELTEKQFTNRGYARDSTGKSKDTLGKSSRQAIGRATCRNT
mgnify:CR=1 FL=1